MGERLDLSPVDRFLSDVSNIDAFFLNKEESDVNGILKELNISTIDGVDTKYGFYGFASIVIPMPCDEIQFERIYNLHLVLRDLERIPRSGLKQFCNLSYDSTLDIAEQLVVDLTDEIQERFERSEFFQRPSSPKDFIPNVRSCLSVNNKEDGTYLILLSPYKIASDSILAKYLKEFRKKNPRKISLRKKIANIGGIFWGGRF